MGNWLTDAAGSAWGAMKDFTTPGAEMMTDPHSKMITAEQRNLLNSLKNPDGSYKQELYDSGSPFDSAMLQALGGNQFGSPDDIQGMGNQQVEDYFRSTIQDPTMRDYQNNIRPAWMEKVGNLHSSYRDKMEQRGMEDLGSNLSQQRGNLMYQNLLRNQDLSKYNQGMDQNTQQMNLNARMQAMGMNQAYDPRQMALNMLQNQQANSQVVQTPSGMDTLNSMMGLGGGIAKLGSTVAGLF